MKIAVDLDNTVLDGSLITHPSAIRHEALGILRYLADNGFEVWYFTSRKQEDWGRLEKLLREYGFPFAGITNVKHGDFVFIDDRSVPLTNAKDWNVILERLCVVAWRSLKSLPEWYLDKHPEVRKSVDDTLEFIRNERKQFRWVILEGVDGVGKTPTAKYLCEYGWFPYREPIAYTIHDDPYSIQQDYNHQRRCFFFAFQKGFLFDKIVGDRSFLSGVVYGNTEQPIAEMEYICEQIGFYPTQIIILLSKNIPVELRDIQNRYVKWAQREYVMLNQHAIPIVAVDVDSIGNDPIWRYKDLAYAIEYGHLKPLSQSELPDFSSKPVWDLTADWV